MEARKGTGNGSSKVGRKPAQEQHVANQAYQCSRQRHPDKESGGMH